jgi:hypothetical protein
LYVRAVPRKKRTAPRTIWIAEVLVSEGIAEKITSKHGLDPDEIATLTKSPPPKIGRWVTDQRGTRLFVKIRTSTELSVLVVLYPLGDDIWRLASAYVLERQRRA